MWCILLHKWCICSVFSLAMFIYNHWCDAFWTKKMWHLMFFAVAISDPVLIKRNPLQMSKNVFCIHWFYNKMSGSIFLSTSCQLTIHLQLARLFVTCSLKTLLVCLIVNCYQILWNTHRWPANPLLDLQVFLNGEGTVCVHVGLGYPFFSQIADD